MKITSIIFDLGGVLFPEADIDIVAGVAEYAGAPVDVFGREVFDLWPNATIGRLKLRDLYKHAIEKLHLSRTPEELLAKHLELYDPVTKNPDPAIDNLISRLQRRYLVACLTNTEPEVAQFNRRRGVFNRFKPYDFLSVELGLKKPDPKIYECVIDRIGVRPQDAVFIDDKVSCVEGAQSVGIRGILYKDPDNLKMALAELGVNSET